MAALLNSTTAGAAGVWLSESAAAASTLAWEWMTDNYSEYQIATYGSLAVQVVFYFGTAVPGFIFQFLSFMKQYKVQMNKSHCSLREQWLCLRQVMLSKLLIYLPLLALFFHLVAAFGLGVPYDYSSMPPWYSLIARVIFCMACEDTFHYWGHRLLHQPPFYGLIHKMHHTFDMPFAFVAEYAHPLESVILGIGFFIPLPFVCSHLFVLWCWLATRVFHATDSHSGFDFPWLNPLYLLPGYGGVRFHDFHHSYFNANYASTFTWWDRICGTDKPYTLAERKRREAIQAQMEQGKKKD